MSVRDKQLSVNRDTEAKTETCQWIDEGGRWLTECGYAIVGEPYREGGPCLCGLPVEIVSEEVENE